jgi:hypothetical protein
METGRERKGTPGAALRNGLECTKEESYRAKLSYVWLETAWKLEAGNWKAPREPPKELGNYQGTGPKLTVRNALYTGPSPML